MHAELPVISFLCFTLLVVFIPTRRVRCNVASLAIVSWLAGYNLVHGINAVIWAGNVDIRVPVWCDIVTKLLLATIVAVSGAVLCISYRLEFLSSSRLISVDPKSQRNRMLIDVIFCYIIPIIYMAIHFIVQDHRFDLVKDLGCSASIHPSSPALSLMWLPPLIICSIASYFSGRAMHNFSSIPYDHFSTHIQSRSPLTSSIFVRRVVTSLVINGSLCLVCLFSVFSISTFESWTSWSAVHAEFAIINIVTSPDDIQSISLAWWGIPVVSIIYIFLSVVIGEEAKDVLNWTRELPYRFSPLTVLPARTKIIPETPKIPSLSHSLTIPRPRPEMLELKSGWDDMLDDKRAKWWTPSRKSCSSTAIPKSPIPSPGSMSKDDTFIAATLDYLVSPTAKTLGLSSSNPTQLSPPLPVYTSPGKTTFDSPHPFIPPSTPSPNVPEDAKSTFSSVFDAPWPLPPPSPPGIVPFRVPQSRPASPASFNPNSRYPIYPAVAPSQRQSSPFQDSCVPSPEGDCSESLPRAKMSIPKRPSIRSLRRTLSSEKFGLSGSAPGDIIYMTVVKETA